MKKNYKKNAQVAVKRAVDIGKLDKPDKCSNCDAGGMIHGHHADYTKPLEVIWLCPTCHKQEHRQDTRKHTARNTAAKPIHRGMLNLSDIGNRMAHIRGSKAQSEMASIAGVTPSAWSQWECGKKLMPWHKAIKFDLSLDWLYLGKGNPPE